MMSTFEPPVTMHPCDRTQLDMGGLSWILFGHAAFQYLNAACELNLYELLKEESGLSSEEIGQKLKLAPRATDILLLGATSLGTLIVEDGRYRVAEIVSQLMDTDDWERFKDTVAFEQHVVYEGQIDFTESLRNNSNVGLRRVRGTGGDLYRRLSENPHMERIFYKYMRSWSELGNKQLVDNLDLSGATKLLDCGGGDGVNSIALARANPDLKCDILEISETAPLTESRIAEAGLSDRISVRVGDMHEEEFPSGYDTVMFAHQFVIWTLEQNTELLRKAYRVLPEGGRVIIFNSMSNDEGDGPIIAALDSVYFASLPAEGGMIYPWAKHEDCLEKAGFDPSKIRRLTFNGWTPHGAIVATK